MRRLVSSTFLTLDGVMQAPGGPEEDESGSFAHGGWSVSYWDDDIDAFISDFMGKPLDLILGRKTYDIFAAFWPTAPEEQGGKPLNDATKYVASRGTPDLSWDTSVLLQGDVAAQVAELKQQDGPELQVHGSGDLLQTLLRHNLLDEIRVLVYPVVIGSGKRLFGDGTVPAGLKLVEGRVSPSGVFLGRYQPAGEVPIGTFGAE